MSTHIRPLEPGGLPHVVDLFLQAWAPLFASMRTVLGDNVFLRLHPDWRRSQEQAVAATCTSEDMSVWVADEAGAPVGFTPSPLTTRPVWVSSRCSRSPLPGKALGSALPLTSFAVGALRAAGMHVAMVETAAARRIYDKAGCTLLPVARYFKALGTDQGGRGRRHLRQHASLGGVAEAGEAGDELIARMFGERVGCGLTELVDAVALGVEGGQQPPAWRDHAQHQAIKMPQ